MTPPTATTDRTEHATGTTTVDLTGPRVAVIGTGTSAIRIVPQIAGTAVHLDVHQRTAPYVVPRHDRSYGRLERLALRHVPGLRTLCRTAIYWGREAYVPAFTRQPRLAWPAGLQQRMRRTVWHTGGCSSWYLDDRGNNTTLWPRSTFAFRGTTASFDEDAFRLTRRRGTSRTRPDQPETDPGNEKVPA